MRLTDVDKILDLLQKRSRGDFKLPKSQKVSLWMLGFALLPAFAAIVVGFFVTSPNWIIAILYLLALSLMLLSLLISSLSGLNDMRRIVANPFSYILSLVREELKPNLQMIEEFYEMSRESLVVAHAIAFSEIEEVKKRFNFMLGAQERVGLLPSVIATVIAIPQISGIFADNPQVLYMILGGVILLQILVLWVRLSLSYYQPHLTLLEKVIEWKKESEKD